MLIFIANEIKWKRINSIWKWGKILDIHTSKCQVKCPDEPAQIFGRKTFFPFCCLGFFSRIEIANWWYVLFDCLPYFRFLDDHLAYPHYRLRDKHHHLEFDEDLLTYFDVMECHALPTINKKAISICCFAYFSESHHNDLFYFYESIHFNQIKYVKSWLSTKMHSEENKSGRKRNSRYLRILME